MNDKRIVEVSNAAALHEASMAVLEQARVITAELGENAESMAKIGTLLQAFSASGVLDELLAVRPGNKHSAVDIFARHEDGSVLSFFAMENWKSPASDDVHWHNYWQILLVVEGTWPDSIWQPIDEVNEGKATNVVLDRREVVTAGKLQTLGPNEPHGWLQADDKRAAKATLLMWSGSAKGKPRIVLDPSTGALSEDHSFLNPDPANPTPETSGASAFSWVRL